MSATGNADLAERFSETQKEFRMFVVEILIPVFSNAGEPFADAVHEEFERTLLALFGGLSLQPGTVQGAWLSDAGVAYRDELRIYAVAIESIVDGDKVRQAVDDAKARYEQEAIFIRYLGQADIL